MTQDAHSATAGPAGCRAWFQDQHYSPEGHWIECSDNRVHLGSVVDWIGLYAVAHGERDEDKGPYEHPCLCGGNYAFTAGTWISRGIGREGV